MLCAWRRGISFLFAGAVSVAVLVGCSQDEIPGERATLHELAELARSAGFDAQAAILERGSLTVSDYDEAMNSFATCVENLGMTFDADPAIRSRLDGYSLDYFVGYGALSESAGFRASEDCFDEHAGFVSMGMHNWGEWQTDPALMSALSACVASSGFDIRAEYVSYLELYDAAVREGTPRESVVDCVHFAMTSLYPGEAYGFGF